MIVLILLYLSFFSAPNTRAFPIDLQPPPISPPHNVYSIFIREEESRFNSRSIYGILWSCFSTIFACSWIAVHPNIPAPADSQLAVLRRRLAIMGYVLLAPEFVIMWAARQHYAARNFTKEHEKNRPGWTRVHTFFLIMGGFTLYEEGKPVRVLECKELEELSEEGKIEWPTITKEEIADRSKGDYLSKAIVLFQTTWFIIQCIARGAYGLDVTELEVVTVAFASLAGVIYYLWWDKPLDVRCSIPVHVLPGQTLTEEEGIEKEDTARMISPPKVSDQDILEGDKNALVLPSPSPPPAVQGDTSRTDIAVTNTAVSNMTSPPHVSDLEILEGEKNVDINPSPLPSVSFQVDPSTPDPALTPMQRFHAFRRRACKRHGVLFGLGYVFIVFPLKCFLLAFRDMMGSGQTPPDKSSLRVPTLDQGNVSD